MVDVRGTGSLVNAMLRDRAGALPEVGMGCTELLWTDRHAATIVDGGVEPDAEGYTCAVCGEPAVCGIEQGLLLDRVEIVGT